MEDIAPILLDKIKELFNIGKENNENIKDLLAKLKNKKAGYIEAGEFADELGKILAEAYGEVFTMELLPDGRLYYNIATRTIEPTMKSLQAEIADFSETVQEELNKRAKLGISPIKAELNQNKIDGIIDRVSNAEKIDDIKWILNEPIKTFARSVVDDSIKANAEFQGASGLTPKIIRKSSGNCCEWCTNIVGSYEYPNVPQDVYRRHNRCGCTVDYVVGKYRKNVHNNNTGTRRYVKDKYGSYVLSKDARIERAKQMAATEKERKEAARQKRIETWEKKKNSGV